MPCGAISGYFAHRRANEQQCPECLRAMREYVATKRKRRPRSECAGGCGRPVRTSPNGGPATCYECRERSYPRRTAALRALKRAAAGSASNWAWCQGECAECGEWFTRHAPASPFCSRRCSRRAYQAARRAQQAGMKVTPARRHRIHERDGWLCHICGDPVNREATVPELDSPVLDHVIALARGGEHSEANLKTAHFYCNSVKRDLPLSDVA